ncbi:winged helix-turn-helix transcriptional regulator [Rhodococcus sp. OK302]|uniref:winged helix-turn-helix transcriptional regulator n=1 Tax=Rhodococcus sp. OK302 TaxID=1882769 RepID=UPI000B9F6FE2|nr:helix-turn-helix domain-containing protein [Rhodococcus sp. OK302]OYD60867.1 HxlR family transcriptional regulator [Rhodococcus sp. OK302]
MSADNETPPLQPRRRPANEVPGRPCSIATTLSMVGERWTLLVVRELSLGNHRFSQIADGTGASRDILTARLRAMESGGLVYRQRYQDHPPRSEYHLTAAGKDLYPFLAAMREWGDRWLVDEPPVSFAHTCGHQVTIVPRCAHCRVDVDLAENGAVTATSHTPEWTRHNPD